MDKNELERRLEAAEKQMIGLQDEIANLKAKLDEAQEEIPDYPVFANGEGYWFVNTEFEDIENNNFGRSTGIEYEDFNMFHTKEMAQEFANKCKLIAMMLHCKWYLCREYEPDWDDANAEKWQVCHEHGHNRFAAHCVYTYEPSSVFFDTIQNAKKCADWLSKHWKENENE